MVTAVVPGDVNTSTTPQLLEDRPCWLPLDYQVNEPLMNVLLRQFQGESSATSGSLRDQFPSLVLYESNNYVVLNKPPDVRMDGYYAVTVYKLHVFLYPPSKWHREQERQELLQWIESHVHVSGTDADDECLVFRPCHQLDYATSGVLLVAKNKMAADFARLQFESRGLGSTYETLHKEYLAVVQGHVVVEQAFVPIIPLGMQQWQHMEQVYRHSRGRLQKQQRRKSSQTTFAGYQPASSLFSTWCARQRSNNQGGELSIANGTKRRRSGGVVLSALEWQSVWATLDAALKRGDTAWNGTTWKDVKQLSAVRAAFEEAAAVYNRLAFAHYQQQQGLEATNVSLPLPPFFRIQDDDTNTLYVCIPLAQVDDDFAMRVPPGTEPLSQPARQNGGPPFFQSGSTDLDYKPSLTAITVVERAWYQGRPVTKVRLQPLSGRRHQLRVHCSLIGHAIVGDATYGNSTNVAASTLRMCLHAHSLLIPKPSNESVVSGVDFPHVAPDPFVIVNGPQGPTLQIKGPS
jgi:23S rRNA-/tRNA-specific pseudouridylate synthase